MSFRLKSTRQWLMAILILPLSLQASDQIESVQPPVWVESASGRIAATPGAGLGAKDTVRTAANGKVFLRLAEGSLVKLGYGAVLERDVRGLTSDPAVAATAPTAATADTEAGFYEGALRVLEGAFRYSTTVLSEGFRRDISIRTGNVATIGIRGTDVWGRAGPDSALVALIEGRISITPTDGAPLILDTPLQAFVADRDTPRGNTLAVTMEQVLALAPETELDAGAGILTRDGRYTVQLASYRHRASADGAVARLQAAGYPAERRAIEVNGESWHRVQIRHAATLADARALTRQALSMGFTSPWVSR